VKLSDCKIGDVVVFNNEIGFVRNVTVQNLTPEVEVIFEWGLSKTYYTGYADSNPTVINLGPGEFKVVINCGSYDSLNPPESQVSGKVEVTSGYFDLSNGYWM
jgi:hypothetical protein